MSTLGLIEVIHWLEDVLDRLELQRSYGGAIAYNYYGPPRLTQDVDILVLTRDMTMPALVEELRHAGCVHDDRDMKPVDLRTVLDDLRGRTHCTVFLYAGVRIEMFVPWHAFHRRVLERSPARELEGRRIRIHSPEDLIVFKKIFDRPKDIGDIKAMLMAQQGRLDLARLKGDARGLLSSESFKELELLIAEYA
jgi:hypothetical protein